MPYRRYPAPGAAVFITQVVARREPLFAHLPTVDLLRSTLHETKSLYPFEMLAYVFLPDHLHLLMRPQEPVTFSRIMAALKSNFSRHYRQEHAPAGPVTIWQKGFWDHIIRDQEDMNRHVDYVHYNPVKHGWCDRPEAWPHSSFVAWKERGFYPDMWGWSLPDWLQAMQTMDVE